MVWYEREIESIIIIQSKPSHNFTIFQLQLPTIYHQNKTTSLPLLSFFLYLTQTHTHTRSHAHPVRERYPRIPSCHVRSNSSVRRTGMPFPATPGPPPLPPPHPLFPYLLHFISHSFLWVSAFWVCESLGFISVNVVLFFFGWGLVLFALFWISMILESNLLSLSRFAFVFCSKCSFLCTSKFCFLLQSTFSPT